MEADAEEIAAFDKRRLAEVIPDEVERELASWNSRARLESLKYYLPLGWSFVAREKTERGEGPLAGYFIAQPLLFFDGMTQTLWVEHLQFVSLQARDELCELAYKLAREKHLQRVIFPNNPAIQNASRHLKAESWGPQHLFIRTTKG